MRILPITFNSALTPGIRAKLKTNTRRGFHLPEMKTLPWVLQGYTFDTVTRHIYAALEAAPGQQSRIKSPYGVGDVLYVRESYMAYGYWRPDGLTPGGRKKFKFKGASHGEKTTGTPSYYFPDDCPYPFPEAIEIKPNSFRGYAWYKRLARFMPRQYARTFVEVTNMRLEHLHQMTLEDFYAEGIRQFKTIIGFHYAVNEEDFCRHREPQGAFRLLWDSVNGEGSYDANPWVWTIEFKLTDKPHNF